MNVDLIIKSRRIVTREGVREGAIVIRSGKITAVVSDLPFGGDKQFIDVQDSVVMPGLIDTHVHINEPGRSEWEGFETATRAAAAGGVTTVVDMPLNSTPVTTTVDAFEQKLAATHNQLWVDCGFYAGLVPGNHAALAPLLKTGVLGLKAFLIHSGIDDFPNVDEADLRAAMPMIAANGLPLLVHAELNRNDRATNAASDPRSFQAYLASRPKAWENQAIRMMIALCRDCQCRVHIVHLSSAESLPELRRARQAGLPLTVETCPHYLFFSAEEISDGDTRFKCAPPIREHENREQLWQALKAGDIDFIASDHSPCPPSLKLFESGDFQRAWGGIASLQFTLPVMWTAAQQRGFSLLDLSEWLAHRPALFVGLSGRKGVIAEGYDADLVVWNPEASFTLTAEMIHHRHKATPYEGQKLNGIVEMTFLRGQKIFDRGHFGDEPLGKAILSGCALFTQSQNVIKTKICMN